MGGASSEYEKSTPLRFRPCRSDFCLIKIGAAWEKTERRGVKSARHGLRNRRGVA